MVVDNDNSFFLYIHSDKHSDKRLSRPCCDSELVSAFMDGRQSCLNTPRSEKGLNHTMGGDSARGLCRLLDS